MKLEPNQQRYMPYTLCCHAASLGPPRKIVWTGVTNESVPRAVFSSLMNAFLAMEPYPMIPLMAEVAFCQTRAVISVALSIGFVSEKFLCGSKSQGY